MINTLKFLIVAIIFGFILSCSDDDQSVIVDSPATYDFQRDENTTVSFDGQTTRINMANELIEAMLDFDQTATTLIEMYSNQTSNGEEVDPFSEMALNESTKSIKSKVAVSNDLFSTNATESAEIKADIQSWIEAQVSEVFPNNESLAQAGQAGQIADGSSARYVSAKGLEYNQAVNKSLIGALMIDQICNNYLSTTILDESNNITDNDATIVVEGQNYTNMEHKWDEAYGYLFGASSDAADPLATLGEGNFLNKYLARVNDDSDFQGIATKIYEAYKLGRAAIVVGAYDLRDDQAEIIKEKLAQVVGARAIFYLQNGKNALEVQDFGGAFHALSEGFGFVYSLRFIRSSGSSDALFSTAEVNGFISQLMANNGFWDVSSETLDNISEDIASKFGFTVAQAAE